MSFCKLSAVDVCIVSPGLLEVPTIRGGGIEENDYRISLQLSKDKMIVLISPFFGRFVGRISINKRFVIEQLYFPATRSYPLKSKFEMLISILSITLYSVLVAKKVVSLRKQGLKLLIVSDKFSGLLPLLATKLLGVKTVYSEGNLYPWVWPYLFSWKRGGLLRILSWSLHVFLCKHICNLVCMIRAQSERIADGMTKLGISRAKIKVIGVGVNTNVFRPKETELRGETDQIIRIGFLGRLVDEKGVLLLLQIAREAVRELSSVKFLIMGSGPYENIFKRLPNVEHVGFVSRDKLPSYLSKIHIILSFQRDLGLSELEAMACGKAIVAANLGGVPKIVHHMENGLLCDLTPSCYLQFIKLLLTDHSLLARLSENAGRTVMYNFSWEIISSKWLELVHKFVQADSKHALNS